MQVSSDHIRVSRPIFRFDFINIKLYKRIKSDQSVNFSNSLAILTVKKNFQQVEKKISGKKKFSTFSKKEIHNSGQIMVLIKTSNFPNQFIRYSNN